MIERLKRLAAISAAAVAIGAGFSAAWAAAEWLEVRPVILKEFKALDEQVAALTRTAELQRWQFLIAKLRANGRLDEYERLEFCHLGARLGLQTPGCA